MKGAWAATDADQEVLAADASRSRIVLQHQGGEPVWLGFGESAVAGSGILLSEMSPFLQVSDARAQLSVHMVCGPGTVANGGYDLL